MMTDRMMIDKDAMEEKITKLVNELTPKLLDLLLGIVDGNKSAAMTLLITQVVELECRGFPPFGRGDRFYPLVISAIKDFVEERMKNAH
jgi:hypothetical protein